MKLFTKNILREKEVTKADKVWLQSIVKRQYMVVDDLIAFSQSYPDKVDKEIVGSLFSIYEMLRDANASVQYAHAPFDENKRIFDVRR